MWLVNPDQPTPSGSAGMATSYCFMFPLPAWAQSRQYNIVRAETALSVNARSILYHAYDKRTSVGYFYLVGKEYGGKYLALYAREYRGYSFKNQSNKQMFPSIGTAYIDTDRSIPLISYSCDHRLDEFDTIEFTMNESSFDDLIDSIQGAGATIVSSTFAPHTAWYGYWFAHRAALSEIDETSDSCPRGPFLLPVVSNVSALKRVIVASRVNFRDFPRCYLEIDDFNDPDTSLFYDTNPLFVPPTFESSTLHAVGLGNPAVLDASFLAQTCPGGPLVSDKSLIKIGS